MKLITLMRERGVNQTELAAICGVTPITFSSYMAREVRPKIDVIERICNHFRVSPEVFFDSEPGDDFMASQNNPSTASEAERKLALMATEFANEVQKVVKG